jgi:response regulator RpfG family c-di-GMP phosphodiesterase
MTKRKGLEPFDFLQALDEEQKRRSNMKEQKIYAYIERGFYGKQLQVFMNLFPKENFLILVFEDDIVRNRRNTIEKIQEFLQVEKQELNFNIHSNEAGESKSEAITNLVRRPNFVKRIVKRLLPFKEIRKQTRQYFIRRNMKQASTPRLDDDTKKRIIKKYFTEDIQLTQKLTGKDLSSWLM